MILAAERPKHPRSGRPVCVHPEPGRGLGPDRSLAVVPRGDLDIHSAAPPLGVGVLDLRIGVEHASLLVDGELRALRRSTVPLGVRGPATVSRARGLAPARDSALELAVEPYAPDGRAPLEQALAFAAAGPVDGRVVRELGVLEEASGGPYVLSGVQAVPGVQVADGGRSLARERQYLERPALWSLGRGLLGESLRGSRRSRPAAWCRDGRRSGPRRDRGRRRIRRYRCRRAPHGTVSGRRWTRGPGSRRVLGDGRPACGR